MNFTDRKRLQIATKLKNDLMTSLLSTTSVAQVEQSALCECPCLCFPTINYCTKQAVSQIFRMIVHLDTARPTSKITGGKCCYKVAVRHRVRVV